MAKLVVILGPTSSGKTSLALDLCRQYQGEIVSADSRQVYRLMDIGTNKGNLVQVKDNFCSYWSLNDTPIWGVNLVNPNHEFSVGEYLAYAIPKINKICERGTIPFLVGGTGFYIDAVLGNTAISRVPPQNEFRQAQEPLSNQDLWGKLNQLNPEWARKIDKANKRRLIRALEIETFKNDYTQNSTPLLACQETLLIGLFGSNELLFARADLWVESVWKKGLIEETQLLIKSGYVNSRPMCGLVYDRVAAYLSGLIEEQEAISRLKFDLHAYIRRQLTWFKKTKEVNWLDINTQDYASKANSLVKEFLEKS